MSTDPPGRGRALGAAPGSGRDVVAPPSATVLPRFDPRTRRLLEAPIAGTLVRLATPNVLVMFVQASVGLIETYFVARLGTDALSGVALVFLSRADADADDVGRRDGRRDLVRHRARPRCRAPDRRRRAGAPRAGDRRRF